jgi:hypothetical protein
MAHLDVPIVGDGESHPIARDVHRQIREAIDRSEISLRWIGEGEDGKTVAKVVDAEGLLVREIGQQVVAVAYQLDNLVALVRTLMSDGSG